MPPESSHHAPAPLPALLDAAAAILRASPWDEMPDEAADFELSCEALGLHGAVAFMYGIRENFAALLFGSHDEYLRWLANAEVEAAWDDDAPPPQAPPAPRSLRFVPPADLPAHAVAEAIERGWNPAADMGCPTLASLDAEGRTVPATATDVAAFEAIARALDAMLPADDALEEAWAGGTPWSRTLTAPTCLLGVRGDPSRPHRRDARRRRARGGPVRDRAEEGHDRAVDRDRDGRGPPCPVPPPRAGVGAAAGAGVPGAAR